MRTGETRHSFAHVLIDPCLVPAIDPFAGLWGPVVVETVETILIPDV